MDFNDFLGEFKKSESREKLLQQALNRIENSPTDKDAMDAYGTFIFDYVEHALRAYTCVCSYRLARPRYAVARGRRSSARSSR